MTSKDIKRELQTLDEFIRLEKERKTKKSDGILELLQAKRKALAVLFIKELVREGASENV